MNEQGETLWTCPKCGRRAWVRAPARPHHACRGARSEPARRPFAGRGVSGLVWDVGRALCEFVADNCRPVDRETYRRRLEICGDCEHRARAVFCGQCWCLIYAKAALPGQDCPKWP